MDVRQMACIGAAGFLGALLVVATTTPARGQSQRAVTIVAPEPLTDSVPYGDLSLALGHDRSVLHRRVSAAVGKVCPILDRDGFVYEWQDCRDFAWRGADRQIQQAIDLARSGSTMAMTIEVTAAGAR